MTESKPPAQGRILQPIGSIVATPTATGHTYLSGGQYPQFMAGRGKVNQAVSSAGPATTVQHSVLASPAATQFHVQLSSTKSPLTVVTSKQNSAIHPVSRPFSGVTTIVATESHVKASVKPVGIQKVSYVKQVTTTAAKSPISTTANDRSALTTNMVPQVKKGLDATKPVLIAQGLRQPSKGHFQYQVTRPSLYADPPATNVSRSNPVNTAWAVHPQESKAPKNKQPPSVRSSQSSAVTIGTPHDLSKKHSVPHQPKTTISLMPALSHIAISDPGHRNAAITVPPALAANKQIYQIMPGFQNPLPGQTNHAKKLQTMIVTQVSSSSAANSALVPTFVSSGQITVMTCGSGITYVPAPTPPPVTNSTSIPIAKVYPQQQPVSRISVTATSGRLSVPIISTISGPRPTSVNISRSTPTILQIPSVKSSTVTSTVMAAQTTIVSTLPVAENKTPSPSPMLCWPTSTISFIQSNLPLATASTDANLVPATTLTSTMTQHTIPPTGTIRVPHSVLVDHTRTTHLQAAVGTTPVGLQASDVGRSNSNPGGIGPTTPTVSPKPAILRRQRPESSSAFKKLSFQTSSTSLSNQRPGYNNSQLKADRRSVPYQIGRSKVANSPSESKASDIAVMIPTNHLNDKNEVKPVLANQVYGKQNVTSNGLAPLKVSNIKSSSSSPFSDAGSKESNSHSFSIHPVSIDMKVKMEPGVQPYQPHQLSSVKTESASASQILQHQNQSMHTYAAESPQTLQPVQHRIVAQSSGQHIKTNTIFASPSSFAQHRNPTQPNGRAKSNHGAKPASSPQISNTTLAATNAQAAAGQYLVASPGGIGPQSSHSVSSFMHSRLRPDGNVERPPPGHDIVKKERQPQLKLPAGIQIKTQPADDVVPQAHNHAQHHQMVRNMSPARTWSHLNNTDSITGLSPRKRPRKQTHVVSEDPPEVEMMEDEESTDDADECEDEPLPEIAIHAREISGTPTSKLPGHKPSPMLRAARTETASLSKKTKEESGAKFFSIKTESPTSDLKPLSEFTDSNGVRYVATRKRPAVSVLNRLKPNGRSIANHFMRYTDIKVKDKKTVLSDLACERKRLKGFKVALLASQLTDMVGCEKDIWQRMQTVYEGLKGYKSMTLGDSAFDDSFSSPSPSTPTCLSNSFHKSIITPRSSRSSSLSGILENGSLCSPSTPLDRRAHKVQEEITKIEELAQANLQRCEVVSDQMLETKTMLLKSVDHRQHVEDVLEASTNQKSQPSVGTTHTSKRMPKKKSNS